MKKTRTGLTTTKALMAGAAIITLSSGVAPQAMAASGTGAASAIILAPIVVTGAALHFGSVTDSGAGGTVVITPTTSTRSVTGATTMVTGGALEKAGIVHVVAANNAAINLTMAATSITVTSGGNTMAVNAFNIGLDAAGPGPIASTLVGTTGDYNIGGTLTVAAAQAVGTYTGTYTVNVNYQ